MMADYQTSVTNNPRRKMLKKYRLCEHRAGGQAVITPLPRKGEGALGMQESKTFASSNSTQYLLKTIKNTFQESKKFLPLMK